VIAFLTNVNEHVGDSGRTIQRRMTTSDVLDTGLALQPEASVPGPAAMNLTVWCRPSA